MPSSTLSRRVDNSATAKKKLPTVYFSREERKKERKTENMLVP